MDDHHLSAPDTRSARVVSRSAKSWLLHKIGSKVSITLHAYQAVVTGQSEWKWLYMLENRSHCVYFTQGLGHYEVGSAEINHKARKGRVTMRHQST